MITVYFSLSVASNITDIYRIGMLVNVNRMIRCLHEEDCAIFLLFCAFYIPGFILRQAFIVQAYYDVETFCRQCGAAVITGIAEYLKEGVSDDY